MASGHMSEHTLYMAMNLAIKAIAIQLAASIQRTGKASARWCGLLWLVDDLIYNLPNMKSFFRFMKNSDILVNLL